MNIRTADQRYVEYLAGHRPLPPADALPHTPAQLRDAVERAHNLPAGTLGRRGTPERAAYKAALVAAAVNAG